MLNDGTFYVSDQIAITTPRLLLNATCDNGVATISWPWPADGFVLQQKPSAESSQWTDVTNTPFVTNYQSFVTLPLASEALFRLKK